MSKKPLVSSLSLSFRKAVKPPESAEEAKIEHRQSLHTLVNKYMDDVQVGKAEGIRNAKDLVEIMKMDLLLLGEATDRTDNVNGFDESRVQKIGQVLDLNSDTIRDTMASMFEALNSMNDEADSGNNKKTDSKLSGNADGKSIIGSSEALAEIARQAEESDTSEDEPVEEN